MLVDDFRIKAQRGETPFFSTLKRVRNGIMKFYLPMPRLFDPLFRTIELLGETDRELNERILVACYRYPLFRAKCVSVGKGTELELVPHISGNLRVYIGDDVRLSGKSSFSAGRVLPEPELRIGNRTFIGHGCTFSIAKSITVGDDVLIAGHCHLFDYSGHPVDARERIRGAQVGVEDVRPIKIGNRAWLGRGVTILPGVTIGDEAIVGAAAVVTKDVPAGCVCVGNPGKILPLAASQARASVEGRALEASFSNSSR